ncbi:MAG: DNA polymerase III subunit beta [Alphaproteobacteria bacterium GM7ARS4]|nr:DNA polymerase III subunit beta [Alphaproteobacteria bacterium GM7ARS4]
MKTIGERSLLTFSIDTDRFKRVIDDLYGIVGHTSGSLALTHVLFDVQDDTLEVTATDSLMTAVETVPLRGGQNGKVTLPAALIHSIVRSLDGEGTATIKEEKPKTVVMTAGHTHFDIAGIETDMFPPTEFEEARHTFNVDAATFSMLMDATSFAMSEDEGRPHLGGIFMERYQGEEGQQPCLRMVATDGHRMAIAESILPNIPEDMPSVTIPRRTVRELKRLLAQVEGSLTIGMSENQMSFSFGQLKLASRLFSAKFPNYLEVIPKNEGKKMNVGVVPFRNMVTRVASVLLSGNSPGISFTMGDSRIEASALDNMSGGSAREGMKINWEGERLDIGYNPHYILDIFKVFKDGDAHITFPGEGKPTLIFHDPPVEAQEGEAKEKACDIKTFYVLMPLRV